MYRAQQAPAPSANSAPVGSIPVPPAPRGSSRTGTRGERGDARGMGIGVEECGQRAGPYVSSFARAACTVQHLAPSSREAISRAGNISPVFPVSQARRLLRKPLLELTMKALVAAVSACLLLGVQEAARAAAGDEVY